MNVLISGYDLPLGPLSLLQWVMVGLICSGVFSAFRALRSGHRPAAGSVLLLAVIVLWGAGLRMTLSPRTIFSPYGRGLSSYLVQRYDVPAVVQADHVERKDGAFAYGRTYARFVRLFSPLFPRTFAGCYWFTFWLSLLSIVMIFFVARVYLRSAPAGFFAAFMLASLPLDIRYAFSDSMFGFYALLFLIWAYLVRRWIDTESRTLIFPLIAVTMLLAYGYPVLLYLPAAFLGMVCIEKRDALRTLLPSVLLFLGMVCVSVSPAVLQLLIRGDFIYRPVTHPLWLFFSSIVSPVHAYPFSGLVTPLLFRVLLLIGAWSLLVKKQYSVLFFVCVTPLVFLLPGLVYAQMAYQYGIEEYTWLYQDLFQFLYILVSAAGVLLLVERMSGRGRKAVLVLLILGIGMSPFVHRHFITQVSAVQKEFQFMIKSMTLFQGKNTVFLTNSKYLGHALFLLHGQNEVIKMPQYEWPTGLATRSDILRYAPFLRSVPSRFFMRPKAVLYVWKPRFLWDTRGLTPVQLRSVELLYKKTGNNQLMNDPVMHMMIRSFAAEQGRFMRSVRTLLRSGKDVVWYRSIQDYEYKQNVESVPAYARSLVRPETLSWLHKVRLSPLRETVVAPYVPTDQKYTNTTAPLVGFYRVVRVR